VFAGAFEDGDEDTLGKRVRKIRGFMTLMADINTRHVPQGGC